MIEEPWIKGVREEEAERGEGERGREVWRAFYRRRQEAARIMRVPCGSNSATEKATTAKGDGSGNCDGGGNGNGNGNGAGEGGDGVTQHQPHDCRPGESGGTGSGKLRDEGKVGVPERLGGFGRSNRGSMRRTSG